MELAAHQRHLDVKDAGTRTSLLFSPQLYVTTLHARRRDSSSKRAPPTPDLLARSSLQTARRRRLASCTLFTKDKAYNFLVPYPHSRWCTGYPTYTSGEPSAYRARKLVKADHQYQPRNEREGWQLWVQTTKAAAVNPPPPLPSPFAAGATVFS